MITFKDIVETNKQLSKTKKLINTIKKTESAYRCEATFNSRLMQDMNKLIGKYFTEKTKAYVHNYYDKSSKSEPSATLQISKAGIGKTNRWSTNITPFQHIISDASDDSYYDNKGMINTVINNKVVFDKCLSHMSENGKYILNSLKEAYEHNKINDPDTSEIITEIKALPEEAIIFKKIDLFIKISDNSNVTLNISRIKKDDSYSSNGNIFQLNSLNMKDERDFMYNLFVDNHAKELEKAINDYKEITTERLNTWKNFNEELNEKLKSF